MNQLGTILARLDDFPVDDPDIDLGRTSFAFVLALALARRHPEYFGALLFQYDASEDAASIEQNRAADETVQVFPMEALS